MITDRITLVLTFGGEYEIQTVSILVACPNLGLTQHAYRDCDIAKTIAITDAAKPPGVPVETSRIPNPQVRIGLNQNVALTVLEGLKLVKACHENPVIPAHAVEERISGYPLLGWK